MSDAKPRPPKRLTRRDALRAAYTAGRLIGLFIEAKRPLPEGIQDWPVYEAISWAAGYRQGLTDAACAPGWPLPHHVQSLLPERRRAWFSGHSFAGYHFAQMKAEPKGEP
jgi:hypothetical protein